MTADTSQGTSRMAWAPLVAASVAQFVLVVDTSMMAVAVPAIVRDLGTSVSSVQAAIALYPLVTGALMLAGGKAASRVGTKRAFMASSIVFGVGAVVAVFATGIGMLTIGWAVIEGLGAAVLAPLNYVLIIRNYEDRQRILGFGILSGVGATASAVGPVLGGYFTTYMTWRLGFGLQVIGIVLAVAFASRLKSERGKPSQDIDWIGTLLSGLGFTLVTLAVVWAPRLGWWDARRPFEILGGQMNPLGLSPVPFMIGAGLISFAGFLHWSQRRIDRGREPLVRPDLLRIRQFSLGVTVEGIANMTFDGLMFMLPLFFQVAIGFSAFETGLVLVPISVSMLLVSLSISRATRWFDKRSLVLAGMLALILGLIWLWAEIDADMTVTTPMAALLLMGAGAGAVISLMSAITLSAAPEEQSSEASSVSRASMRIARSLGTAIVGAAFISGSYSRLTDGIVRLEGVRVSAAERDSLVVQLEDLVQHQPDKLAGLLQSLPAEAQSVLADLSTAAVLDAARSTLLITAALIFVALLAATFLRADKRRPPVETPSTESIG